MDTKWKKWKSKIGFLAFFLGINLLITSAIGFTSARINYNVGFGVSSKNKRAEQTQDYQYRRQFEDYMSRMLISFLDLACGEYNYEDIYGYSGYYGDVGYAASDTLQAIAEDTAATEVAEAIPVEEGEQALEQSESDTDYASSDTEPMSKKEWKEYADNFHEHLKDDKNLLYRISYNGKVIYSNMENINLENALSIQHLPEGYNFYLHFDGQKVTAGKDGEEIDIYGDGIYRENESWSVPGYKNFTSKEKWHNAEITMLAAAEPISYTNIYGTYYNGGSYNQYGELYQIYQRLQTGLWEKCRAQILLGISVLFLILYVILRKEKRTADEWFASKTKHLWFECKLLLLIAAPLLLCCVTFRNNWPIVQEYTYLLTQPDSGMFYGEYLQEMSSLLSDTLFTPAPAAILFWILYFFLNDIRKNRKIYKTGITAKFLCAYRRREAKLPVTRKLIYRLLPVFGLSILLTVVFLLLMLCPVLEETYHSDGIRALSAALFLAVLLLLAALIAAEYQAQKKIKRTGLELERLAKAVSDVKNSCYDKESLFPDSGSELYFIAEDLEKIYDGIEHAVTERTKSERMKVELVANVSHDIKTPLTSIVSYIQLLKQEENLPDHVRDYIHILDEKAERLKNMVQDVFSVSKAASGQLEVDKKELDFTKLLEQTLADMQEQIAHSPVTIKTEFPSQPVTVLADGSRMYRVFQNLISNALKYSLEGSRVYLTLQTNDSLAAVCIRSTSREELRDDIDFTERFTRGDKSRTDGGSGLGLSIAKSFTEACGGSFHIEVIADLFVVTVTLPRCL